MSKLVISVLGSPAVEIDGTQLRSYALPGKQRFLS